MTVGDRVAKGTPVGQLDHENMAQGAVQWAGANLALRQAALMQPLAQPQNVIPGLVGWSDRLDYLPAKLSGGQTERVVLARALVGNPDVILDRSDRILTPKEGRIVKDAAKALPERACPCPGPPRAV